jgi:hypothetical protein
LDGLETVADVVSEKCGGPVREVELVVVVVNYPIRGREPPLKVIKRAVKSQ